MSKCGAPCEIYSRVCGYIRPTNNWNRGKLEELRDRKLFDVLNEKTINKTKDSNINKNTKVA